MNTRRFFLLFACGLLVAFLAGGAGARSLGASMPVGVADDAAKYADDGGSSIYQRLKQVGMKSVRFVVYFDPSQATTIQEKVFLDRSVPVAAANGIEVVFSVYPQPASTFATDTDARVLLFASYLKLLAQTYPQVRTFVVLNEPNEAFFMSPQFSGGQNVSAGVAFKALAAAYDALKSVSAAITVYGFGISNEANDTTSTSPVRFLKALGEAYKASGRTTPIMDRLGLHLHPKDSSKFTEQTSYPWPNWGPADHDRIKQAFWDAFNGTGQPTYGEGGASGGTSSGWFEVAVQSEIPAEHKGAYTGVENVALASEATQAAVYPALVKLAACDPAVSAFLFFLLIDQKELARFQSGFLRANLSERPSFATVGQAITEVPACTPTKRWTHTEQVIAAKTERFELKSGISGVTAYAEEDALGKAGIFQVAGANAKLNADELGDALDNAGARRVTQSAAAKPIVTAAKLVQAYFSPRFELPGTLRPGHYVLALRLRATMNPKRVSTFVGPIVRIGQPSRQGAPKGIVIVVTETVGVDDGPQLTAPGAVRASTRVVIVVTETISAEDNPQLAANQRGGQR